ncbi:(R,R)-butanediol dehydrogenase / meso-butanediol dehydrogenase / diacetyl reductase [Jatrophihabitans endophyticus]|uniref:(R,R)-butanediol dehydrogenase / meso-butanediol dehydrogenase / diacetyl reductase n=1 Tax=Jatrophihabitans endophyticus TaxID=1206085 RepID=A0A1M5PVS5_9ACTN|nr:alcohol dehydrogenase catalytic domain-containing protein [Jatrophihabitans endophyticus]SHH05985.1 (R,R)-butanediol dehydrogenase / meso-butanediol dehydrogenase / diacetyl reductase [Jatrophihabitans endophyticus]
MRALRWHGAKDVRLEDVAVDALGPDEVRVQVAYCGICGSDLAEYRQGPVAIQDRPHVLTGHRPPVTLGHEFAGTVTAVGERVRGVAVGDRVAADATLRCGVCLPCTSGRYNHCALGGSIGLACDGAMADSVRIPAYCAVPLPDEVPLAAGALLEPYAVALHALDRAAVPAGGRVLVSGFGPIGAAVAEVAHALGLRVLVSEPNAARRAAAERLGHRTIEAAGDARTAARAIRTATAGGADAVIECSGSRAGLEFALELTRRGADIVAVGLPKEPITLDAARLILFERGLLGALGYQNDLPRVAGMIAAGVLDPTRLVSRVVPLADAAAEFARLTAEPGADLKVLLQPEPA